MTSNNPQTTTVQAPFSASGNKFTPSDKAFLDED